MPRRRFYVSLFIKKDTAYFRTLGHLWKCRNLLFSIWEVLDLKGFPGGSNSKESVCNVGDLGSVPGSGRSPGEEMATHSSILAWRIIVMEETGGLQSMGLQKGHNWATNTLLPLLVWCNTDRYFGFVQKRICYFLNLYYTLNYKFLKAKKETLRSFCLSI